MFLWLEVGGFVKWLSPFLNEGGCGSSERDAYILFLFSTSSVSLQNSYI